LLRCKPFYRFAFWRWWGGCDLDSGVGGVASFRRRRRKLWRKERFVSKSRAKHHHNVVVNSMGESFGGKNARWTNGIITISWFIRPRGGR
jgi:hypothetical protein